MARLLIAVRPGPSFLVRWSVTGASRSRTLSEVTAQTTKRKVCLLLPVLPPTRILAFPVTTLDNWWKTTPMEELQENPSISFYLISVSRAIGQFSFKLWKETRFANLASMSDSDEDECPLCMEEIDVSDRGFKPCPCGYQVRPATSWTLTFCRFADFAGITLRKT